MTATKIKVSIIDDHPVVIEGLRNMLATKPDIHVITVFINGRDLLNEMPMNLPDVLLLDIKLPDVAGDELVEIIGKNYPQVKVIALTYLDSMYFTNLMMKKGVKGYLLKTSTGEDITEAIRIVYNGGVYLAKPVEQKLLLQAFQAKKPEPIPELTKREKEVLQLLASNYSSQQIADKLYISRRTVESHRSSMLLKLKVKNSASLIKKAIELNLLNG